MPLPWKVHDRDGGRIGALRHPEDAAALVAAYGEGATIRYSLHIVWIEGGEIFMAGFNYHRTANICRDRMHIIETYGSNPPESLRGWTPGPPIHSHEEGT